ncbi:MAG: 2-oxo-4-hydroxy-4-carboxy-5-ureidoimidazoline decarboxylase [Candidatus Sericytochromatia bacterium]
MNIEALNNLSESELKLELEKCCGAENWVANLANLKPFKDKEQLLELAEKVWFELSENDWLEAFKHHPKIGDVNSLAKKYANTKKWAEGEQSGVNTATQDVIQKLADGNKEYEEKFGYIFIVCATGKSAEEMLDILTTRLPNSKNDEIKIAMGEQNKITKIRLEKLLNS